MGRYRGRGRGRLIFRALEGGGGVGGARVLVAGDLYRVHMLERSKGSPV